MRLIDNLRNAFHLRRPPAAEPQRADLTAVVAKAGRTEAMRKAVTANPSAYNRATRRLYGLRGRAVPRDWVQPEFDVFVPRFIRRHIPTGRPTTRRQRKVVAHVRRLITQYGLA